MRENGKPAIFEFETIKYSSIKQIPISLFSKYSEWRKIYKTAGKMEQLHVKHGTKKNKLSESYIDGGFNELIYQWDSIWEVYSPDLKMPGTTGIPNNQFLSKQNFAGWSGLDTIALLIENVFGFKADANANTLK